MNESPILSTGRLTGQTISGDDKALRRPELRERTDVLNEALDGLEKATMLLRERLEPVLAPSTPEPDGALLPALGGDGSWLSDYLEATTARVHGLAASLLGTTRRVDL